MNNKEYHNLHKEEIHRKHKEHYLKNKQAYLDNATNRYKAKKQHCLEVIHEYYKNNKKRCYEQRRAYHVKKLKTDIAYKLRCQMSIRINNALKLYKKSEATSKLVGCSFNYLKQYISSKFKKGMTWKNYGKWQIDHIVPCCKFNLSTKSEQKKCFHYTNLQPLWAKDNLSKGGS